MVKIKRVIIEVLAWLGFFIILGFIIEILN
jgi:hypothetical protein